MASQTEADIHVTLLAYTNLTTTVTQPTDTTIRHVHTATGELASHTDEDGNSISIASDADGRRSSVTDRRGGITRLAYHAASGKPAAITNVDGTVTLFSYSTRTNNGILFFDLTQTVSPDGTTETFDHDANGNA